jgi:hypothetical protein
MYPFGWQLTKCYRLCRQPGHGGPSGPLSPDLAGLGVDMPENIRVHVEYHGGPSGAAQGS